MFFKPFLPLESAESLDAFYYYDRKIFLTEKRSIFNGMWHYVGRKDQVSSVGSFFTTNIGDEPIVVLRNQEGIAAFSNVCRHRGTTLAQDHGSMNKFVCPYHGWTYDLNGSLLGCTEPNGWQCLDKEANGLVKFEVQSIGPWIFVNRSHVSFDRFIKGLKLPPLDRFAWRWQKVYDIKCNWKVFVDNYLDGGYHIPYSHQDLATVADYGNYKIEQSEFSVTQTVPLGDTNDVRKGMAYYVWLFPNFMINVSEGVLDTNLVIPVDEENCKVVFDFYFTPEVKLEAISRSEVITNRIQEEDIEICERVQRGLRSNHYKTGRYHVREEGMYYFHKLVYGRIT